MMDANDRNRCRSVCFGMAALAGVIAAILSVAVAGIGWGASIFIGLLGAVILALLLPMLFCGEGRRTDPADLPSRDADRATAAGAPSVASTSAPAEATASSAGSGVTRVGDEAAAAPLATTPDPKPVAAASGGTAGPAVDAEATAEDAGAPDADAAPAGAMSAPSATTSEEKPADLMTSPRAGAGDDLKRISGVGPKLEQTLNELGIWHFDQVAKWGPAEIAWVDARLRFKGRIERDDWMSQARTLAAGGETEFSRKKKS